MRKTKGVFFFSYSPVHSCYFGYIVCMSALKLIFVVRDGRASREVTRPLQHVGACIKALSKTRVRLSFLVTSAITSLYKGSKSDLMGVFLQI